MSEKRAIGVTSISVVERAIGHLPPKLAEPLLAAVKAGKDAKLTSKQANLVAAAINEITGERVICLADIAKRPDGTPADPTTRGCLDPNTGTTLDTLLGVLRSKTGVVL